MSKHILPNCTLLYLNKKLHERNLIVFCCFLVSLQPIHVCFFCSSHCTVYSQLGLAAVFKKTGWQTLPAGHRLT